MELEMSVVPVVLADVKGGLSSLAAASQSHPKVDARIKRFSGSFAFR
ncbi:MAG: DUF853 family protein [Gammaproteobacteria bacterium]|nr:DUF853 family protein [Gammaproteobacteria bacterium]